ncbi:MAG: diguanylate cyclase, partial [Bacteroidota bacterium]
FEQYHSQKVMQYSSIIDISTGLYNPPALYQRLEAELFRSQEFGVIFSFVLISIDKYSSFDPAVFPERMQSVQNHVYDIIRKHLKPYDIFGRVDAETLGLILVGFSINEAKIWAERLRSEVAMSVMEFEKKRFNVTISIGIAECESIEKVDRLVENAHKVHDISASKTNCVSIYV